MTKNVLGASLAAGLLTLTMAACSDSTPNEPNAAPTPQATSAATEGAAPTTPAAPATPSAADRNAGALQAVSTAADAANGTPYEIDDADDDGSWEVDVMVDARTHEVTVSADGRTVVKTEEDDADTDDRRRLERAGLSLAQAIEVALREVPGTLDDVELDDENDVAVWKVSIAAEGSDDDVEVYVDVRDGRVLKVDR